MQGTFAQNYINLIVIYVREDSRIKYATLLDRSRIQERHFIEQDIKILYLRY